VEERPIILIRINSDIEAGSYTTMLETSKSCKKERVVANETQRWLQL